MRPTLWRPVLPPSEADYCSEACLFGLKREPDRYNGFAGTPLAAAPASLAGARELTGSREPHLGPLTDSNSEPNITA